MRPGNAQRNSLEVATLGQLVSLQAPADGNLTRDGVQGWSAERELHFRVLPLTHRQTQLTKRDRGPLRERIGESGDILRDARAPSAAGRSRP